jgi:outer membrane lipoprotein-sorting protein
MCMRKDVLAIVITALVLAASVLSAGCTSSPAGATITAVTTDKDLYHSNEVMNITISVMTSGNLDNTTVRIEGINDRHGRMRLSHEIPANLSTGAATFMYDYQLPSCSSCAGLDPGTYQVNITLVQNGVVISNMSRSVQIEQ